MKKLAYVLIAVFSAMLLTSCFHDDERLVVKPTKTSYTHFVSTDDGTVHQFNYDLNTLKSTVDNTPIQFIRFTSFYSEDDGQRNMHEIEVISDGVNIAVNKSLSEYTDVATTDTMSIENFWKGFVNTDTLGVILTSNRTCQDSTLYAVDGKYTYKNRWSSHRHPNDIIHMAIDKFTRDLDTLMTNITTDSILLDDIASVNDTILLNKLDSIISNTVYPDTVNLTIDLRKPYVVDEINLYVGPHTQIFNVEISADGVNWILLKPEDVNVIKE